MSGFVWELFPFYWTSLCSHVTGQREARTYVRQEPRAYRGMVFWCIITFEWRKTPLQQKKEHFRWINRIEKWEGERTNSIFGCTAPLRRPTLTNLRKIYIYYMLLHVITQTNCLQNMHPIRTSGFQCIYIHSGVEQYYNTIPRFYLVLRTLVRPFFSTLVLQNTAEISIRWKESVHLSVRHCYCPGALNYVNFSSEVTFLLTSGGKLKRAHFTIYVSAVTALTLRGKLSVCADCGRNAEDGVEDLRNVCSCLANCYSLSSSGSVRCLTGALSGLLYRNISP